MRLDEPLKKFSAIGIMKMNRTAMSERILQFDTAHEEDGEAGLVSGDKKNARDLEDYGVWVGSARTTSG